MHREIEKDKSFTFTWKFFTNNLQDIPSTASITILKPGGTELVASTAGTIDSEGTITYTLSAALAATLGKNYRVNISYVLSGATINVNELFDIVRFPITNNARDEDLFQYVGELRNKVFERIGQTTAVGTTTTLIDDELQAEPREWKGGFVEIYIDTTTTWRAVISSFAQSTGTVTFTPAYPNIIPTNTAYSIRTSYQDVIDKAYDQHVYRDIRNKVPIAAGYIDGNITRNMTVFKTLEIICVGQIEEEGDKWDLRHKMFKEYYSIELTKLDQPYDTNEDGSISDQENRERPNWSNIDIVQ